MDDNLALRQMIEWALCDEHRVVTASDGAEALATLREDPAFDLILSDLSMPGVDGAELFSRATESNPELRDRFVFMTGGPDEPHLRQFVVSVRHELPVLEKPLDLGLLRQLVGAPRRDG